MNGIADDESGRALTASEARTADRPLSHLAAVIIWQAVRDCTVAVETPGPRRQRIRADIGLDDHKSNDARQFLCKDNPDLRFWCDVGGLDAMGIVRGYHRTLCDPAKVARCRAILEQARHRVRTPAPDVVRDSGFELPRDELPRDSTLVDRLRDQRAPPNRWVFKAERAARATRAPGGDGA